MFRNSLFSSFYSWQLSRPFLRGFVRRRPHCYIYVPPLNLSEGYCPTLTFLTSLFFYPPGGRRRGGKRQRRIRRWIDNFDIFFFYLDGGGDDFRDNNADLGCCCGGGDGNRRRGCCCWRRKCHLLVICPPLLELKSGSDGPPIRTKPYSTLLWQRHCNRCIRHKKNGQQGQHRIDKGWNGRMEGTTMKTGIWRIPPFTSMRYFWKVNFQCLCKQELRVKILFEMKSAYIPQKWWFDLRSPFKELPELFYLSKMKFQIIISNFSH